MDRYKFLYMDKFSLELIFDVDVHTVNAEPHLAEIFAFDDVVGRDEFREAADDVQKIEFHFEDVGIFSFQ